MTLKKFCLKDIVCTTKVSNETFEKDGKRYEDKA